MPKTPTGGPVGRPDYIHYYDAYYSTDDIPGDALFNRPSLSPQPAVDFSFQPSSDFLSFEFTFVTSVTALGFQFNLYLSEYLNTYAALILGSSLSKKRDL